MTTGAYFAMFFGSLALLLIAPNSIRDPWFAATVLSAWFVGGIGLWLYARMRWRCPACGKRSDWMQTLASLGWQFCPHCGVPLLRRSPETSSTAETHDLRSLKARFERRYLCCGSFVPAPSTDADRYGGLILCATTGG